MTTDVAIIGGGPNGLLLACELALAGVRPAVLERLPERVEMPKANGLVGRVVQALDYRGLYERLSGGDRRRCGCRASRSARCRWSCPRWSGAEVRYGDGSGHPMTGRWMPDLPLRTRTGPTRVGELLRGGRPVLLTTAGGTAKAWTDRVDLIVTADAPADTVLIRPDG